MADYSHAVHESLGGHNGKPEKKIARIEHEKSHNGDHVFTHHHTHPEHYPKETHTKRGDDEMVAHMIANAGTPNPGEAEADAGQSGIPGEDASAAPAAGAAPAPAAAPPAGGQ